MHVREELNDDTVNLAVEFRNYQILNGPFGRFKASFYTGRS